MSPHNGDQKLRKCLKSKKVTNRIYVCKNEPPKFEGKFLIIFACKAMSSSKSKESNFSSPVVGVVGVDQLELQCQLMEGQ